MIERHGSAGAIIFLRYEVTQSHELAVLLGLAATAASSAESVQIRPMLGG